MDDTTGKLYYSISEVCGMTGLKPHVLRYWETTFSMLKPSKNQSGNRIYRQEDIDLIMLIKRLLHDERYTIEGARQRIEEMMKSGGTERAAENRARIPLETLQWIRKEISDLLALLDRDPMAVDKNGEHR